MLYLYFQKFILTLALFGLSLYLPAQVKRAITLIDQEKFEGVENILRAGLADKKDRVFAHYGLARLFASSDYSSFQLDSAYRHIEQASLALKALDYKEKGKISKELSTSEIRKQRTNILKAALKQAETENTVQAYDHFLEAFPKSGSRYEGKAMSVRNKLVYDAARLIDTELAYTQLLDAYGADLKAKNPAWYAVAEKRQFELHIAQSGWDAYPAFAAQHPNHIYVRDSLFYAFKALWSGPTGGFYEFITSYPAAPISSFAQDSLGARLVAQADTLLSPRFLQEFKEHSLWDDVYATWYENRKMNFTGMSDLERFKTNHPDFPYPERLASDSDLFLDKTLDKLQVGKALGAFRAFIDKYPNYGKIDTVWHRYYQTYKQERPGRSHLDRFMQVHPNYPFPEEIAEDRKKLLAQEQINLWKGLEASEGTGALFEFTQTQKRSPYYEPALDLLAERLVAQGGKAEIESFLIDHSDHSSKPELLFRLWDIFPEKEDYQAISDFKNNYPDFPQPELLEQAQAAIPLSDEDVQSYSEAKRPGFIKYIQEQAPQEKAFEALWRMITPDFAKENWDGIYESMRSFQANFRDKHPEYSQWLPAFAPKNRVPTESISPLINTEEEEYSAVITADDQTIYFCRNANTGQSKADENILVAQRDEAGNWQKANIIEELLTTGNEAPQSISADGNRMLIFVNGQICTTEKTKSGWSTPKPMSGNINRSNWQADPFFTADGKALIFTSMNGSAFSGHRDIYISLLQEDGSWGPAQSIGDNINTQSDDRSAFLHPDMKTLYFSSGGHRGLGGLDIFIAKRLDESWSNWSEPINLGPGVNTVDNDWSFKVTTDGKYGYYNVVSLEVGGDIFMMPLPEKFQPDPVATVSGKLMSIKGDPIDARINWINLKTGAVIQTTTSNPGDGTFFATLPSLGRYGYTIEKEGYFPISGNLDFSRKLYHHRLEKEMTLVTVEEMKEQNIGIALNNLFFETAKYDIKPESFPELNGLAAWVLKNDVSIEVQGHTDQVGEDADNLTLSRNRANAVRDYLIEKGLSADRIKAEGFGESRPVAGNDTEEGRAQNRRVEIKIE